MSPGSEIEMMKKEELEALAKEAKENLSMCAIFTGTSEILDLLIHVKDIEKIEQPLYP